MVDEDLAGGPLLHGLQGFAVVGHVRQGVLLA